MQKGLSYPITYLPCDRFCWPIICSTGRLGNWYIADKNRWCCKNYISTTIRKGIKNYSIDHLYTGTRTNYYKLICTIIIVYETNVWTFSNMVVIILYYIITDGDFSKTRVKIELNWISRACSVTFFRTVVSVRKQYSMLCAERDYSKYYYDVLYFVLHTGFVWYKMCN